jgi:hypothetical protein
MHAGHTSNPPGLELFAHPRHPIPPLWATPGETASLASGSIPGGLPGLRPDLHPAASGRRRTPAEEVDLPHRNVGERHLVACWHPL